LRIYDDEVALLWQNILEFGVFRHALVSIGFLKTIGPITFNIWIETA